MTIRLTGLLAALAMLTAGGAYAQGANDAPAGPPASMDAPAEVNGAATMPGTGHMMHMRHHGSPAGAAAAGDATTPAGKAAAQALNTAPGAAPVPYVDFQPQAAPASGHGAVHHAVMRGHMAAKKAAAKPAQ